MEKFPGRTVNDCPVVTSVNVIRVSARPPTMAGPARSFSSQIHLVTGCTQISLYVHMFCAGQYGASSLPRLCIPTGSAPTISPDEGVYRGVKSYPSPYMVLCEKGLRPTIHSS